MSKEEAKKRAKFSWQLSSYRSFCPPHTQFLREERKNPRKKKQVHTLRKFLLGYFFFLNYLRHFLLGILGLYPEERALLVFSRFTVETSCLQSVTLSTGPALFQGISCIRPLLWCWNPLSVCVYLLPRKKWKKMARFQTVL